MDGKHVAHYVNRLVKHHIVHIDTNRRPKKIRREEKEEREDETEKPLEVGDIIAYRTGEKSCPFGIGEITEIGRGDEIFFQCYGYDNGKEDQITPGGFFWPQWVGKGDTHYARKKPYGKPRPYTNYDALKLITTSAIICKGEIQKFLSKGRVTPSLRTRLDDEIGPIDWSK